MKRRRDVTKQKGERIQRSLQIEEMEETKVENIWGKKKLELDNDWNINTDIERKNG